jgi:hypothetical protein
MKNLVVLDLEVYPNYTLFAFKGVESKKVVTIELKGGNTSLSQSQAKTLRSIMCKRTTFGFNSRNYDMPLILYALKGHTAEEICNVSNYIINENSQGWQTKKRFNLEQPSSFKHFDVQEPAPAVRISLKLYGARQHSVKLQDLPIEPNSILTEKEMEDTLIYCINDLDTTIELYENIKDRIVLRRDMSERYGQDLLSKSDAQIAETVIKSELLKINPRRRLKAPILPNDVTFRYTPPSYIKFKDEKLNSILNLVTNHEFELDGRGSVKLPKELRDIKIDLGYSVYNIGIGGLHSTEKKQSIIPNTNQILADRDVESYYPSIVLNEELYPKQLGESFLDVYQSIVTERLKAKKEGNKLVSESLKIVINGSFGKLGSKYSALYSPDLMIAVTLTGQLALLMLIERLENKQIKVVSANTDGFVSLMDKSQYSIYDVICFDWELDTGFKLEENKYEALYSRDVNNYLAVTKDGYKGKGLFAADSLSKSPAADICAIAVIKYLTQGKGISDTIRNCKDLTKFLSVRTATGGALWRDEYLGRVVRWIYSTEGDTIRTKKKGDQVAKADSARPIMNLDCEFPKDLDYDRYEKEAMEILENIGYNTLHI